ncbi:SHOCT domain-containing protein [Psychromonas antarctica]|uniref:SHOCT domain-containing protein n=1 Tax=Psychromonas antarctica TaxID=67573 RepID=UPI001EE9023A|nr:SHOCT domain-containing protein [Psychromonas antarctica]MCG6201778.1 SHOCT domain-containing protein [Psychromonas antarctica]
MQKLTDIGENLVNNIASRYALSHDAVVHMLIAVNNGGGSMAQFNCPELGGSGQWMRGGMTMVGDMFNNGLKNTVDNLCNELANILANNQVFPIIPAGTPGSSQWWPSNLGNPFSSGAQNNTRYAIFPNRLAVELNGQVSVYDTLDHHIGGVSQQQGSNNSLTFNSQWGTISVSSLPLISGQAMPPAVQVNFAEQNTPPAFVPAAADIIEVAAINSTPQYATKQTLEIIEKLAQLRDLGALTDDEFNIKKTDLLNRI